MSFYLLAKQKQPLKDSVTELTTPSLAAMLKSLLKLEKCQILE